MKMMLEVKKLYCQDYFSAKGHDKEFIEEMVQDYSDSWKII